MIRTRFDETEGEFYMRVQKLRAAQWAYLSPCNRQDILDYLASYRKIERPDPALKERLRVLVDETGY